RLVVGQGDVLNGVDLPDFVGIHGLGNPLGPGAAAAWPMDPRPDESDLEASHGGDVAPAGVFVEGQPDQSGPPRGVGPVEVAGDAEHVLDAGGNGTACGAIPRRESLETLLEKEPPDVADGAIGDGKFGGDLGQRTALAMALDDLLTTGDGQRLWHGTDLGNPGASEQGETQSEVSHKDSQSQNFPAHRRGQTLLRVTSLPAKNRSPAHVPGAVRSGSGCW